MGYYKTIGGRKLDGQMVDEAARLAGDGRLSTKDAETLFGLVKDGGVITEVEKETIEYLFTNFLWTTSAEEWFRKELQSWQSHKVPVPSTVAEISTKHFAKTDVLTDSTARATRMHMLEAATSETNQDHDEIGLWIRLSDGVTVEVFSNFIELAGDFVQLRGGCLVPVRAIEKVEI